MSEKIVQNGRTVGYLLTPGTYWLYVGCTIAAAIRGINLILEWLVSLR